MYDPASARIAAEAAYSMTKKILALGIFYSCFGQRGYKLTDCVTVEVPPTTDKAAFASYLNTVSRYVSIKEEQAHLAKQEVLVLWTDFFKPQHLEQFPDLHNVFWNAAKNCSYVKQEVRCDIKLLSDQECDFL